MPNSPLRRRFLHAGALLASSGAWGLPTTQTATPPPSQARTLVFPRDAGAHTDFKTEWWYLTGWANLPGQEAAYGFQITFFRSRVEGTQAMRSRLAARQLLFAHAALTDVAGQRLWHDQRMARWSGEAPGQNPADSASASSRDTGIVLQDWSLLRAGADLQASVRAEGFALDLRFASTQPLLLQGQQGLSRKGPDASQTSYYYSLPQLQVSGNLTLQGKRVALASGSTAWLDHEWSQQLLQGGAIGWDWLGINLFDGSALTAFRLRDQGGGALWDGGSLRSGASLHAFSRGEVSFQALRHWQSPASRARYPVEWLLRTPADAYTVKAVIDNQELDSSQSTGAIYWEGLSEVWDRHHKKVGRGYLEMTGYVTPMKL